MNLSQLSRSSRAVSGYQKSRAHWSQSRYLDNHFDEKIHSSPFLPTGSESHQFIFSDIGLSEVRTQSSKLKNYHNLEAINSSVATLTRQYPEMQTDDPVIIVEYCTNCKTHQQTTRHNEEQYYAMANQLKALILTNYPHFKIYLKPLKFESENPIERIYLQRRIGCFEVIMKTGTLQKTLYSKLESKKWPVLANIIKEIHQQLKKTNLLVQLAFEDSDSNLKDIEVSLTCQNRGRSSSFGSRPSSSILNRTQKSSSFHKQTRVQSAKDGFQQRYVEKSDNLGRVLFMNLPVDKYELSVTASSNHQSVTEIIDISEILHQDNAYHKVKLQKPGYANLRIEVTVSQEKSGHSIPCSEAIVTLESQTVIRIREVIGKSGIYECQWLQIGPYGIRIQKPGFKKLQDKIQIQGGQNNLKYHLEEEQRETTSYTIINEFLGSQINFSIPQKKRTLKPPKMELMQLLEVGMLQVVDFESCQPLYKATIRFADQSRLQTCSTNSSGEARVLLSTLTRGTMLISCKDYYDQTCQYNHYKDIQRSIALVRRPQQVQFLFETDGQIEIYKLMGSSIEQLPLINKREGLYKAQSFNLTRDKCLLFMPSSQTIRLKVQVLENKLQELIIPKSDTKVSPQIWVLGQLTKDGQFTQINMIYHPLDFKCIPNYLKPHEQTISKVYPNYALGREDFIAQSLIQYHPNGQFYLSEKPITQQGPVRVHYTDGEFYLFFQNSLVQTSTRHFQLNLTGLVVKFQVATALQPHFLQQANNKSEEVISLQNSLLNSIFITQEALLVMYEESPYIAIFNWTDLNPRGVVKLEAYRIDLLDSESKQYLVCSSKSIQVMTIVVYPNNVQFQLLNSVNSFSKVTSILAREVIFVGREDGYLQSFDRKLVQQRWYKCSSAPIVQIQHYEETIAVLDRHGLTILTQELAPINKFSLSPQIMLHSIIEQDRIYLISQTKLSVFSEFSTLRQPYYYDPALKQQTLVQVCGESSKMTPTVYYLDGEPVSPLEGDDGWHFHLERSNPKPFQVLIELKGCRLSRPVKVYLKNELFEQLVFEELPPRASGYWLIGSFILKDYHDVQSIENRIIAQAQPAPIVVRERFLTGAPLLNQNAVLLTQSHMQVLNIDSQCVMDEKVLQSPPTFTRMVDDALLVGHLDGTVTVWQNENNLSFWLQRAVQLAEKPLLDATLCQGSLIFSSEERKLVMVSLATGLVEYQEVVDKSVVTQLLQYQKTLFVAGYQDGRLRIFRKDRQGSSGSQFIQNRTIQSIKVQVMMLVPWEPQNLLVGSPTGQLAVYNLEQNKQLKIFPNEHVSAITALSCISNQIVISGCQNGTIIQWNYPSATILRSVQLPARINSIIRTSSSLIYVSQTTQIY